MTSQPGFLPLRLVWIDLEMTGLNARHDAILEIAVVITGPDLKPLAEIERVVHQPPDVLDKMSARVRQIHTDNGLLKDVNERSVDVRVAEKEVLGVVAQHTLPGQGLLCGRSVDHDWRFLVKDMPRLEQHLHFHRVDVSTIGVLVDNWFPGVRYEHPETTHRAMDDVKSGLEEMRFYCRNAFKVDLDRIPGIVT